MQNENLITSIVRLSAANASLILWQNGHTFAHEEISTFFSSQILFSSTRRKINDNRDREKVGDEPFDNQLVILIIRS